MGRTEITLGDEVVFARLDLADVLGIWRNATGRVVETHDRPGDATTLDVKFEGHEMLQDYLATLFKKPAH